MNAFQLFLTYELLETTLGLLCLYVFYRRRHVLVPLLQFHTREFLGINALHSALVPASTAETCEGGNEVEPGETYCEEDKCQSCCPHDERDHGICLSCEHEEDPGAAIDRAMDAYEDR